MEENPNNHKLNDFIEISCNRDVLVKPEDAKKYKLGYSCSINFSPTTTKIL